jgi:hypothetical protein
MMKWLRKNNKMLLAVFMAFLMVVFVGGSALQNLLTPDPTSRERYESNLGPISGADLRQAKFYTDILESRRQPWRAPFGPLPGVEPLERIHWILLTREAEKLGFAPSTVYIESLLRSQGVLEDVERNARLQRIQPKHFFHAIAQYMMIREAAITIAFANRPSEAAIRNAAEAALDKVRIEAVVIPATAFLDEDMQFTEQELAEHVDKYRDKEPEGGLQFGYRVPPSVRVEYVRIDRDDIATNLRVGESTLEREAREYYASNRTTDALFRRPAPEQVEGPPDENAPKSEYFTWEEAESIAKNIVRNRLADQAAKTIANYVLQQMIDPWAYSKRGADGYREKPKGVDAPGYLKEIVENIPGKIAYRDAVSLSTTGFFTAAKATTVPEIGPARVPTQTRFLNLGSLAFKCQGVAELPKKGDTADYVALYEPCRYVMRNTADGDLFVFRVIDTREAHPAESVDEVREEAERDLRLLRGYETALSKGRQLMARVRTLGGLEAAFEADEELTRMRKESNLVARTLKYVEPQPFARMSQSAAARLERLPLQRVPEIGSLPMEIVEKIFALEKATDPLALFEWKEQAKVLLVQWLESLPAREDEFESIREDLVQSMLEDRRRAALTEWLDPSQIQARTSLKYLGN